MTEVQTNAPICKTVICKRPLTWMEKQKCWRCLICNPIPKDVPKLKEEKKFLDVKVTEEQVAKMIDERAHGTISEERIREIVQDELMNWHIQKPPIDRTETEKIFEDEYARPDMPLSESERKTVETGTKALVEQMAAKEEAIEVEIMDESPPPFNWRAQAKELGISLMQSTGGARKKVDVLAEIESRKVASVT